MSDDEYVSTKVTLPKFTGSHKSYQIWWTRMMAYASVYRFTQAMITTPEADMPASDADVIDTTTDKGKRQRACKARNAVAVANLTMAFETDQLMSLVYQAQTTDWPGGLAHMIVLGLKERYQPVDMVSMVEMRQAINKVTMKKDDEPTVLFDQISAISN
jgi:hypothetical protein